jgi:hypothetical protein
MAMDAAAATGGTAGTGGAAGAGTGGAAGTGDGGAAGAGGTTSTDGGGDASAGPCPTAPPAGTSDPAFRDRCTKRLYVAGGDDFRLTLSVDEGKTWQRVQPVNIAGDDFVNDVSVSNGVVTFIGLPGAYASVDGGKTFAVVANVAHVGFNTYGGQFTAGPDRVVLTDNEGTYVSTDGLAWTAQNPFPDNSHPKGFGGHYHGRAFGNQTYVIFQDNGAFRTFDGNVWTQGVLAAGDLREIVFAGGKFVGVGSNMTGAFSTTSTDGKTWSAPQYKDAAGASLAGQPTVVFDGTRFMIFTVYGGKAAYTSPDGATWTKHTLTVDLTTAVFEDGVFFGIGGGKLWFSADGLVWTGVHDLAPDETNNINGPRLAVGRVLAP